MADIERLEAVMTQIRDNPETWDQGEWAQETECGTSYCFAGWAVEMFSEEEIHWREVERVGGRQTKHAFAVKSGSSIRQEASDLLGLTDGESFALFWGGNSFENLETMVKNLANGRDIYDGVTIWA